MNERIRYIKIKKKVSDNYVNADALAVIIVGSAGNTEGLVKKYLDPLPAWSAKIYDKSYAYGILHVISSDTLMWKLYSSDDHSEIDSFVMRKTK